MSIESQIARITADKNTIRNKMVELGVATETDNLDALATKIDGIANNGAVSVEILEGKSYTIPKGWHNGSGVVKAMTDVEGEAEQYKTQAKNITPTKNQQSVTPDEGYYALESVTVEPIPAAYQDVTGVTTTADKVLTGSTYVDKTGKVTAGTMPNNGKVTKTLGSGNLSYTIPKGYHDGTGTVTAVTEEKSATPTKGTQTVTPTAGKLLSKVTVNPIPEAYQDITPQTVVPEHLLVGDIFVDEQGQEREGTMPDRTGSGATLTPASDEYTIPDGYHDGTGAVSVAHETKTVTPTKSTQTLQSNTAFMSKVTVNPIPAKFKDVTGVDTEAAHVLLGKKFLSNNVDEQTVEEGTMPNNGGIKFSIVGTNSLNNFYTIPAGYHDGTGVISLSSDIEDLLAVI